MTGKSTLQTLSEVRFRISTKGSDFLVIITPRNAIYIREIITPRNAIYIREISLL